eukprot:scaffold13716_cov122-Isochrysis_galbana.AAC.5
MLCMWVEALTAIGDVSEPLPPPSFASTARSFLRASQMSHTVTGNGCFRSSFKRLRSRRGSLIDV